MYEIAKHAIVGRIKGILEYKFRILFFAFCSILHLADSRQGFSAILQEMFQDLQEMFREITRILISVKIIKNFCYFNNYPYCTNSKSNKTRQMNSKHETIKTTHTISTNPVDKPNIVIKTITKIMILKKDTK